MTDQQHSLAVYLIGQREQAAKELARLTAIQQAIVRHAVNGYSARQIGMVQNRSLHTVRTHFEKAKKRLCTTHHGLLILAVKAGWTD